MIKLIILFFFAVSAVMADDDGKYRPGKYGGDDGRYRPEIYGNDGRYYGDGVAYVKHYVSPFQYNYNGLATNQVRTFVKPIVSAYDDVYGRTVYQPIVHNPFASRYVADVAATKLVPQKAVVPQVSIFPQRAAITQSTVVPQSVIPQRVIVKSYAGNPEATSRILKQDNEQSLDAYRYAYDTENNIRAEESGSLQNINTNQEGIRATGFYEYIGPDNIKYRVDYIADENGFQPVGDHLPKPHPNIARYLATLKN